MREKIKCREYCSYHLQHLDRVEQFLEKKAQEGWIVYKHSGGWFFFKKAEPKEIRYYVEVFEKEKWNNSYENRVNQAFLKECDKKGWKFVDADSHFQILSCETPETKKPVLLKSGKINSIYKLWYKEYFYVLLAVLVMALVNIAFSFTGIVKMLSSFSQLLSMTAWAVLALYLALYLVSQKRWYSRAMNLAQNGQDAPNNPRHRFGYIGLTCTVIILSLSIVGFFMESHTYSSGSAFTRCLVLLALVSLWLVSMIVRDRRKSWKIGVLASGIVLAICAGIYGIASTSSSIFAKVHKTSSYQSSVIYKDSLPITLNSLGVATKPEVMYTTYHQVYGEFLIKEDYYSEEPADSKDYKEPSFCYMVFRTTNSYLYERVLSDECFAGNTKSTYEELKSKEYPADAIYKKRLDSGYYEYIFMFHNQIIKMNINVDLSNDQLRNVPTL